jgi:hypothetical protein
MSVMSLIMKCPYTAEWLFFFIDIKNSIQFISLTNLLLILLCKVTKYLILIKHDMYIIDYKDEITTMNTHISYSPARKNVINDNNMLS